MMVKCQGTFEQRSGREGARPIDNWGRETEMGTGNIIPCYYVREQREA